VRGGRQSGRGGPETDSLEVWDFSKNWTTNYGPAYRDVVVEARFNFLVCTSQFALCFLATLTHT
jgi:hypothetical protein